MKLCSKSSVTVAVGLLLLSGLTGCQRGNGLPGQTGSVYGNVTFKQAPVPAGSIVVMVHHDTGIIATGVTNSSGNFKMNMRGKPDVLVGEYTVNIRPVGEVDENISKLTPKNVPDTWKAIPQKYWSSTDSPERYTVKQGKNEYTLVLSE